MKLVSSVLDNQRNRIDRHENADGTEIKLTVTLARDATVTAADVEAWYWRHVGEWTPKIASFEPDEAAQRAAGY